MRTLTGLFAAWLAVSTAGVAMGAPPPPSGGECRKLPAGRPMVRLNLKPNTDVADLVAWISSVTCKQFLLPGDVAAGKTVTVFAPQLLTREDAYRLFLDALDSVGLAVYPTGRFLRVIDAGGAKTSPIPVVVPSGGVVSP